MADHLPRPLLVALGTLDQVRRLPQAAATFPLIALTAFGRARRSYDLLAAHGQQVLNDRFGHEAPVPAPVPEPAHVEKLVAAAVAHVEDPLDHPRGPEPIPGYDGMTLGALRGHLRSLSADDLHHITAYEKAHLARPPMLTLVEHRLAKLALR